MNGTSTGSMSALVTSRMAAGTKPAKATNGSAALPVGVAVVDVGDAFGFDGDRIAHRRMKGGRSHEHEPEQVPGIDGAARVIPAVHHEQPVGEVADEQVEEGGGDDRLVPPYLEPEHEGPEDDEHQHDVHDRVGDGHSEGRRVQRWVVHFWTHHEVPHEGKGADSHDGGVGVVLAAGHAVGVAGQAHDGDEGEGVAGQIDAVDHRRETDRPGEDDPVEVPDAPGHEEAGAAGGKDEPARAVIRLLEDDAAQDAEHRGEADDRGEDVLGTRSREREVAADGAEPRDQYELQRCFLASSMPPLSRLVLLYRPSLLFG